jgi:hypothetical protein
LAAWTKRPVQVRCECILTPFADAYSPDRQPAAFVLFHDLYWSILLEITKSRFANAYSPDCQPVAFVLFTIYIA